MNAVNIESNFDISGCDTDIHNDDGKSGGFIPDKDNITIVIDNISTLNLAWQSFWISNVQ